jgi:hypothetical protein
MSRRLVFEVRVLDVWLSCCCWILAKDKPLSDALEEIGWAGGDVHASLSEYMSE